MKDKREQAQKLLEAMERMDEGMQQQALDVDTPDKFRALGKAKKATGKVDKPLTALQRWGAFAACLAVALALAASPWFFSTLLPTIIQQAKPTDPPTTTDSTNPSKPEVSFPNLYITNGDETITAYQICGNWNYGWFDAASAQELLEKNRMPWLTTETYAILEFEIEPDSFEVQCWPADQEITTSGEEVIVTDGMLHLKEGSYVYEVEAVWHNNSAGSGKIYYVFAVSAGEPTNPYEFQEVNRDFLWPSMLYDQVNKNALYCTTEYAEFFCFTLSLAEATKFIRTQQKLLQHLQAAGLDIGEMTYYAVDYGDSFSRSDDKEAYIDLTVMETWQQVLVTLQAILGDYIDYGFAYAMANTIAEEIGWQVDDFQPITQQELDAFVKENPEVIWLQYPAFTTEYASNKVIQASKTLSLQLFEILDWRAINTNSTAQLHHPFREQLSSYASQLGIQYDAPSVQYAYCSARIPLRMFIGNAEHFVDNGYVDGSTAFQNNFANYASIYETARRLYDDAAKVFFEFSWDWQNNPVSVYWISQENSAYKGAKTVKYVRSADSAIVYTRYLQYYMFGIGKHIEYATLGKNRTDWQSNAFCELMRSLSWFTQHNYEVMFTQNEENIALFRSYTGRDYQPGIDDYMEVMDILCHINNNFKLSSNQMAAPCSMSGYLLERFGIITYHLLLKPEILSDFTEQTWEELEADWKKQVLHKYADVVIPE